MISRDENDCSTGVDPVCGQVGRVCSFCFSFLVPDVFPLWLEIHGHSKLQWWWFSNSGPFSEFLQGNADSTKMEVINFGRLKYGFCCVFEFMLCIRLQKHTNFLNINSMRFSWLCWEIDGMNELCMGLTSLTFPKLSVTEKVVYCWLEFYYKTVPSIFSYWSFPSNNFQMDNFSTIFSYDIPLTL